MKNSKKILIVLLVVLGVFVLIPSILAFRFRNLVSPFISPSKQNVNVLILGKGGIGHDAPDLTDTMILVAIKDGRVNLISLPRDIWVPEIRAKLNSAYYWGRQQNSGFKLVDESVEKITGMQVSYNLVLDFSIFKDVVNVLGGIKVDVQNAFVDEKYPIEGKENDLCDGDRTYACRYETIKFEKGDQIMNGETALKFVRSRNAQGDEGTDFAREKRQQLVIEAIKNKLLNPRVCLNPQIIFNLYKITISSIETDIPVEVQSALLRLLIDGRDSITSFTIPEELLVNPPTSKKYDNLYVFIPKSGNWLEVQRWLLETIR